MIRILFDDFMNGTRDKSHLLSPLSGHTLPVVLQFVWERARGKKCLLEFLLGIEATSGIPIIEDTHAHLRISGSLLQTEWLQENFSNRQLDQLISDSHLESAIEHFIDACEDIEMSDSLANAGTHLEALAARLCLERSFKPPIRSVIAIATLDL